jgi:hypothetical protein
MNMRNLIENDDALGILGSSVGGIAGSFIGSACGAVPRIGISSFMTFVTNMHTAIANLVTM